MKPIGNDKINIRLQVFLSHNGVSSRRKAMEIVQSGRVRVNGHVVREPSTPVDPARDHVTVDGHGVADKHFEYIMLNKPAGYVTTKEERPTAENVFKLLPEKYRHLVTIGRLDKNTEGLLIFTNDGDTVYKLTHPKFDVDKTYQVRVMGELNAKEKSALMSGVVIEGKKTAPARIARVTVKDSLTEFLITIHEGRKRQIRLMCDKVGHKVVYLKRLTQGPIRLGGLPSGGWRSLTQTEINQLKRI
ncbi:MAG: pseudouridine synthase [Candidatus Omnitrophota bacterium]